MFPCTESAVGHACISIICMLAYLPSLRKMKLASCFDAFCRALLCAAADNEALAARVAGQELSKADVNRMVAERWEPQLAGTSHRACAYVAPLAEQWQHA